MWAWIKTFLAALVGGATSAAAARLSAGGSVDLKGLGSAALAGAVSTGIAYTMKSPHATTPAALNASK